MRDVNHSSNSSTTEFTQGVEDILSSPADPRHYHYVHLKNGLLAILIQEPEADYAAAALSVHAGHFDDPWEMQGLAHFLEHMLFLGTEDYPEAEHYSQFLAANGGHHNAWTGTEFTNFYFSVEASAFEQACHQFARFFYQPQLAAHWVEKERHAVESEYRLKLNDELRRLYQVHKETSNPAHPFSKFSVGNLTTLADNKSGTLPTSLQTFFAKHYCAERMVLVLAGPQSIDELTAIANAEFSAIKSGAQPKPRLTEPLYLPEQLGIETFVRPVKDARRLILCLPLPAIDDDYQHKTTSYLAHLLGYEGPDSLFSALRQRGWINNLSAGGGISGSNFKDFNINIQLTELGLEHIDDITRWVFATIRLIEAEGIDDWRYEERQHLVGLSFRYQDPIKISDLASQLSINAQHYPINDLVYGDYRMDGLNRSRIHSMLKLMTPDRIRMTVIHRDVVTDQIAKWYDTPYKVEKLSRHRLLQLSTKPEDFLVQLPKPNVFIPQSLEAQPLMNVEQHNQPQTLVNEPYLQVWHQQDPDFRQPKGHIYCGFIAPNVVSDVKHFACARLWCELILDELNERCYDAEIAGVHFNIYPQQRGLTLHIAGFSPGQPQLLETILETMSQGTPSPQRWSALRQKLISNWQSAHTHKPMNKLFAELNYQLQPGSFRMEDLAKALAETDYTSFEATYANFLNDATVEALVHGDFVQSQAQRIGDILQKALNLQHSKANPSSLLPRQLTASHELKSHVHSQHPDTAMLWFVQGHDASYREQAGFMLLNQFIAPEIFNQLRTEQQLGYLVGSNYLPMQQWPGILMYVQSPTAKQSELEHRLRSFISHFLACLPELAKKEWRAAKFSLTRQLLGHDPNLRIRSQRWWSSITHDDHNFDRLQGLAEAVDSWANDEWVQFAKNRLGKQAHSLWLATSPSP